MERGDLVRYKTIKQEECGMVVSIDEFEDASSNSKPSEEMLLVLWSNGKQYYVSPDWIEKI